MHHLQTLRVAVFQVGQRLTEHHAVAAAVAVNQGELTGRFGRQRRFNNRHHRRNAGTGGNRQIFRFTLGLRLVAKVPLRHHHLKFHTLMNIALGIAGETVPSMALTATLISDGEWLRQME